MSNSIPQDTPANTDELIAKWKEVTFAIAGREVEPDERMIDFIATQVRLGKIKLLESIIKPNYAEELNTYDFDGIAESVFSQLKRLKEEAHNDR